MIRKTWNSDKWLLTPQPEHARLSAIIAAAWNFPGEKPSDEVFKAIFSHDDGWKEAEAAPAVDGNGDPVSFHEIRLTAATPIYERSIEGRREASQLYAAVLVAGHFLYLVETAELGRASTADAIAAGQFLAKQRKNLENLKKELSQDEAGAKKLESYEKDLRFLQVCDFLSLLLCTDFYNEETLTNVPYLQQGDTLKVTRKGNNLALTLDPLPFKKNLRDHLTSYIVPYIPYDSPEELRAAMDEVKTVTNEVHFGAA